MAHGDEMENSRRGAKGRAHSAWRREADANDMTLSIPESGELLEVDAHVAHDLAQEAPPDVLTFVDRNYRGTSVFVPPKGMTPLLPDQSKSQPREDRLQLARRDGHQASHAGTSSC
jgi:hypothetical protein